MNDSSTKLQILWRNRSPSALVFTRVTDRFLIGKMLCLRRWCVSSRCDHEKNPASSRQGSKGFLQRQHRSLPQIFLTVSDRAAVWCVNHRCHDLRNGANISARWVWWTWASREATESFNSVVVHSFYTRLLSPIVPQVPLVEQSK